MFQFLGLLAGWVYKSFMIGFEQTAQPSHDQPRKHARELHQLLMKVAQPIAEDHLDYLHKYIVEQDRTQIRSDVELNEIIVAALRGRYDTQLQDASKRHGLRVLQLQSKVIKLLSQTLIQRGIVTVVQNSDPHSPTLSTKRPAELSVFRPKRRRENSPESHPPESCVVAKYIFQRPEGIKEGFRGVLSQDRGVRSLNGKINLYDILRLDGVGRKADLKDKHVEILFASGIQDPDSFNFQRLVWISVEDARSIITRLPIKNFDLEPLFEAISKN